MAPSQANPGLVLNEILINPALVDDFDGSSTVGRLTSRRFIELFIPPQSTYDAIDLKDCLVVNGEQTISLSFPPTTVIMRGEYFIIADSNSSDPTADDEFTDRIGDPEAVHFIDVSGGSGGLEWNPVSDSLAVFCNNTMMDFVAWGAAEEHVPSEYKNYAAALGQWPSTEPSFVDLFKTAGVDKVVPLIPGDSIGRDEQSSDTNTIKDWGPLGGRDSIFPTPGHPNKRNTLEGVRRRSRKRRSTRRSDDGGWMQIWGGGGGGDGQSQTRPQFNHERPRRDPNSCSICTRRAKRKDAVTPQWLVMIYFGGEAEDLRGAAERFVEGLTGVGSTSKVTFVAQIKGLRGKIFKGKTFNETNHKVPGNPTHYTADGLNLFITWAMSNYPARKTMVILDSHGMGWQEVADKPMSDLKKAVSRASGKHDVLFLYNCLMGGIETAYQVRDSVKYIVFSEELMWCVLLGDRLGPQIVKGAHLGGAGMATLVAAHYASMTTDYFGRLKAENGTLTPKISSKESYTVSVGDLSKLNRLHQSLDAFSTALIKDMDDVKQRDTLKDNLNIILQDDVLRFVERFNEENYIDLYHFADLVSKTGESFSAGAHAKDVMDDIKSHFVIFERHGPKHPNAYGVHIYFPVKLLKADGPRDFYRHSPYSEPRVETFLYKHDVDALVTRALTKGHTLKENLELDFVFGFKWPEVLQRFYIPTADACIWQTDGCVKEIEAKYMEKVRLSAKGSSDGDYYIKNHQISDEVWDFDISKDTARAMPMYGQFKVRKICFEDCDRDNVDETDDDADDRGSTVYYECIDPKGGKKVVRLMVFDYHHWDPQHSRHFQVNDDFVTINCEPDLTVATLRVRLDLKDLPDYALPDYSGRYDADLKVGPLDAAAANSSVMKKIKFETFLPKELYLPPEVEFAHPTPTVNAPEEFELEQESYEYNLTFTPSKQGTILVNFEGEYPEGVEVGLSIPFVIRTCPPGELSSSNISLSGIFTSDDIETEIVVDAPDICCGVGCPIALGLEEDFIIPRGLIDGGEYRIGEDGVVEQFVLPGEDTRLTYTMLFTVNPLRDDVRFFHPEELPESTTFVSYDEFLPAGLNLLTETIGVSVDVENSSGGEIEEEEFILEYTSTVPENRTVEEMLAEFGNSDPRFSQLDGTLLSFRHELPYGSTVAISYSFNVSSCPEGPLEGYIYTEALVNDGSGFFTIVRKIRCGVTPPFP